ncbi:BglII/BstYI family type II restriction endonuclease [Nocardia farcinica]|uniref:BglII/BstYI family type II restriction endonuclease n=1 Tax=Nocardia farcinica TaxID=37329 RepID=UPI0024570E5C|nr:BglII/BstYI family type II restriction endonuclease [Nocardia farcinica]
MDDDEGQAVDIAGEVRGVSTPGWPSGYVYGATRYADVILRQSFPERFADLVTALSDFHPTLDELRSGGGGRTVFVKRFDDSLAAMTRDGQKVWGKQNITIEKRVGLEGTTVRTSRVRGHEIDMFGKGSLENPLPGIAVEMEWNNKDPFYDRDLINFQALHHEGAIAVGVIVTRGPTLQAVIGPTIRSKDNGFKYGQSTTHWDKLIPKVNLGGGGECPLLLIGIEPSRVSGIELALRVKGLLEDAARFKESWRASYARWDDAKPIYDQMYKDAMELLPPLKEIRGD